MTKFTQSPEEHAIAVIQSGRGLAEGRFRADLRASGVETPSLVITVEALAAGRILDPEVEQALHALQDELRRECEMEVLQRIRVFAGFQDPEAGDVGDVEERLILTDRGEAVMALLQELELLLAQRQTLLDRLEVLRICGQLTAPSARGHASP